MILRSLNDVLLRNLEDGGGTAAPTETTSTPAAPTESLPKTEAKSEPEVPLETQLEKIWDDAHSPVGRDKLTGRFQSNKTPKVDTPTQVADDGLDDFDDDINGPDEATGDLDDEDDLTAGDEGDDGPDEATAPMPRSWSKEDAKAWKTMPKAARDVVLRREEQMAQVITRAGNVVKTLKANEGVIQGVEPYRDYLKAREQHTGVPEGKMVNDLLRFAYRFDTAKSNDDKLDIINEIVGAFQVDLSPWIGREANETLRPQSVEDPRVGQLMQQVHDLTSRLQQQDQRALEASNNEIRTAIDKLERNTRDFPYYRHVKERMSQEIEMMSEEEAARPLEVLFKDAYERAIWAVPKVRNHLLRRQTQNDEQPDERERRRAEKARNASSTNVKSGVPSPSKRTSDETLEATAARIYGR